MTKSGLELLRIFVYPLELRNTLSGLGGIHYQMIEEAINDFTLERESLAPKHKYRERELEMRDKRFLKAKEELKNEFRDTKCNKR